MPCIVGVYAVSRDHRVHLPALDRHDSGTRVSRSRLSQGCVVGVEDGIRCPMERLIPGVVPDVGLLESQDSRSWAGLMERSEQQGQCIGVRLARSGSVPVQPGIVQACHEQEEAGRWRRVRRHDPRRLHAQAATDRAIVVPEAKDPRCECREAAVTPTRSGAEHPGVAIGAECVCRAEQDRSYRQALRPANSVPRTRALTVASCWPMPSP
jgi:hypothetical protein